MPIRSRGVVVKAAKADKAVSPLVHVATAMLSFLAGFINACGLALFAKTLGNVTGLTTRLGVDLAGGTSELPIVLQFFCFLLGSTMSGVLISSRRAGIGTELYGIVLMLVSGLIFAGWATADDAGVAPCILAGAMGLQNGMLTKHAHAVVRTTHMTGVLTDIGVLIGHQIGRQVHRLALWLQHTRDTDEKLAATRKIISDEWTQLKLLTLLLVAFFAGGVGGMGMQQSHGADALLLPAFCEAVMGLGYLIYRKVLRPSWKRKLETAIAAAQLEAASAGRRSLRRASRTFAAPPLQQQAHTVASAQQAPPHHIEGEREAEHLAIETENESERRPLTPKVTPKLPRRGVPVMQQHAASGSFDTTMVSFEAVEAALEVVVHDDEAAAASALGSGSDLSGDSDHV